MMGLPANYSAKPDLVKRAPLRSTAVQYGQLVVAQLADHFGRCNAASRVTNHE
jgi:hypothetical protein